ncbi:hypothetical protein U1Q18_019444 [Sarracenia purpurea var. burkii]
MGCSEILAFVMAVALVAATREAAGQSTPSCAEKLTPCANYINATSPPTACCDSLKEAITTQLSCICNLYNTPGLLASLGINVTEAVTLPHRCNLTGDLSACTKASSPNSSSEPPPATPGNGKNGVGKIAWTGISSMLLFSASLVLLL